MTQRPKQPPVKHAEKMRRKSIEQKHLQAAKGGRIDVPFLLLVLLLTIIGLVMLFSASFPSAYYETGTPTYYFKRQAIYAAVGLAGLALAARFNYQRWRGASRLLLILSLFLLMLVIIPGIGIKHNNARRWLGIDGVFTFQPSEIAKLAVIVYFADSISKKREKMLQWREGIVPYAVILGVFSILMMLEPHLSGTILIVGTGAIMMAVGGMQRWLIGAGVGGVAAVAVLFVKLVERRRHILRRQPYRHVARPMAGHQQGRLPDGAEPDRHRLRRPAGPGLRQGTAEVHVSAGGAQRLYFRHRM